MDGKSAQAKTRFKTPEGSYRLVAEKAQGLLPFSFARSTRLATAQLDDGLWILYNIGDVLHVGDLLHKEPVRSLLLGTVSGKAGYITCHDFTPASDSADIVVGLADGQVLLLSLRAQLQAPTNSKPLIAASLAPEVSNELARCTAVTWLQRSEGTFAAAFASGQVYLYRKAAVLGEGSSRFSLSIGSGNKSSTPSSVLSVAGGGVTDLAASPCGTRLAAACRDRALRLLDVATGAVVGGFHSYYGNVLCCSFSPDGRYVAAGGEDDLVAVYGVAERYPVAHCQGHTSWVSRVRWDPWLMLGGGPSPLVGAGAAGGVPLTLQPNPGPGSLGQGACEASRSYRIASVGQDCALCLWEVQVAQVEGGDLMAGPVVTGLSMRRSNSTAALGSPTQRGGDAGSAPFSLTGLNQALAGAGPSLGLGHQRKSSVGKAPGGGMSPSLHSLDMNVVQPSMQHRLHLEPTCDIAFTEHFVVTADHTGCVRTWERPASLQRVSMTLRAAMQAATAGSPG